MSLEDQISGLSVQPSPDEEYSIEALERKIDENWVRYKSIISEIKANPVHDAPRSRLYKDLLNNIQACTMLIEAKLLLAHQNETNMTYRPHCADQYKPLQ